MITFEQIAKVLEQGSCPEIDFKIKGSAKFDHCWMGKMWKAEEKRDIYWYGLTGDGKNAYEYAAFEEMAEAKVFDGRSLREVWDDIELFSIDMSDPEEMIGYYSGEISVPVIMTDVTD